VGLDWLTRDLVDQLLAQSVAGLLVDLAVQQANSR